MATPLKPQEGAQIPYLIWVDLEMTGLRPEHDRILEIATVLTDCALNVIAIGPVCALYQPTEILETMDPWCQKTHGDSGLVARVHASTYTEQTAETETLAFLHAQQVPPHTIPLCGTSVGMDRRFLYRYMPTLESYFHYRQLDVSTLKVLAQIWNPTLLQGLHKKNTHTALEDILESIAELRYYQTHWEKFRTDPPPLWQT